LDGDNYKVDKILEIIGDVLEYSLYESSLRIGINYSPRDLSFSKMLLYSWIKEAIENGREHRVSTQGNRR
jgi:hypothetical protein